MLDKTLYFHPDLILRTPALSFDKPIHYDSLYHYLDDDHINEALKLASPDLWYSTKYELRNETVNQKVKRKTTISLINYLSRMKSRCTPFGLFAGCSLVKWGQDETITINEQLNQRHTRLDMHYLCALARQLEEIPFIRNKLSFYPNTSIYQVADEIRHIETIVEEGKLVHQSSSVESSPWLLTLLDSCKKGSKIPDICKLLKEKTQTSDQEAMDFVNELIDIKLLVSDLEPGVTGPEFMDQLLVTLRKISQNEPDLETNELISQLEFIKKSLQVLDTNSSNQPEAYEPIVNVLSKWEVPIDRKLLFQVDLIKTGTEGSLSAMHQNEILEVIPLLRKLASSGSNSRLESFINDFSKRYENQERPLLEVLDPDIGIGYASTGQHGFLPLVEDLVLPQIKAEHESNLHKLSSGQQLLLKKIKEAETTGSTSIHITEQDLKGYSYPDQSLPPSLPVIFRKLNSHQIHLEIIGGSSAVNLVGRFAHKDPAILRMIQDITAYEAEVNPSVIFAEIAHLPEERTGNVLQRPVLREYEIPYLSKSTLPHTKQIALQDILVSVKNGRVLLRSRHLSKEIIPRLSSAHNFKQRSLPVYHFLGDLQTQGLQADISINWNPKLYGVKVLPRLVYKNMILGLASWRLEKEDFATLLLPEAGTSSERLEAFRQKWKLPAQFILAQGDRELYVDTANKCLFDAWLEAIRNNGTILLKEFLFDPEQSPVKTASGAPLANQFIACLLNPDTVYQQPKRAIHNVSKNLQLSFMPGSEWLYYKLYCGQQAGDKLLLEVMAPLIEYLHQQHLIDYWFFIRYQDPDHHIRIRFHIQDKRNASKIMALMEEQFHQYHQEAYVWKIEISTYQREVQRYGSRGIELTEKLFYIDSQQILNYLTDPEAETTEHKRWLFGIYSIDTLLNEFEYTIEMKLALMSTLRDSFAKEFRMDKPLKLQIDQKYRKFKAAIASRLEHGSTEHTPKDDLSRTESLITIVDSLKALERKGELEIPLADLLPSYIHMHINRLMQGEQRLHELLIYDFMARYYQTQTVLMNKKHFNAYHQ